MASCVAWNYELVEVEGIDRVIEWHTLNLRSSSLLFLLFIQLLACDCLLAGQYTLPTAQRIATRLTSNHHDVE